MSKVASIVAYETLHAGGLMALTAKMTLDNGHVVYTSTATNDSVLPYQNRPLLDNDPERYQGKGVTRAVHYINTLISPKLKGVSPLKQHEVDGWLLNADGTGNREKLGVNTLYTISSLFAKAGAADSGLSLYKYLNEKYNTQHTETQVKLEKIPSPIVPLISKSEFNLGFDFKEFLISPSSSYIFSKALEIAVKIRSNSQRGFHTTSVAGNMDLLDLISKAVESLNLRLASDVFLGVDFSSSDYARGNGFNLKDKPQALKQGDYIAYITDLTKKYFPLFLIDPLPVEEFAAWKELGMQIPDNVYSVADQMAGSNAERIKKILSEKICASFILRPEDVGTVSEVFEIVNLSRKHGLNYIFSQSSYETNDSFLSDIAVALGSDFLKLGSPDHGESFSKYNRMLEIEKDLNKKANI